MDLYSYISEGAAACEVRVGSTLYVYADSLGLFIRSATKSCPGPSVEGEPAPIEGHPLFDWKWDPGMGELDMTSFVYPDAARLPKDFSGVDHLVPAFGAGVQEQDRGVWLTGAGSPAPVISVISIPGDRVFSRLNTCYYRLPTKFLESLPKDAYVSLVVGKQMHNAGLTVKTKAWRALLNLPPESSEVDYTFRKDDRVYVTDAWTDKKFNLKEQPMKIPSLIDLNKVSSAIREVQNTREAQDTEKPKDATSAPVKQEEKKPEPKKEPEVQQVAAPEPVAQQEDGKKDKIVRQKKPVMSFGFDFSKTLAYLQSTMEKSELTDDFLAQLTQERRALRDLMIYASRRLFNIDEMLIGDLQAGARESASLSEKLSAISKLLK